MVAVEKLFDQVSIDPDETVSATYVIERTDAEAALFLIGDSNSADVTIEFYTDPEADEVGQFFHKTDVSTKNVDITNGEVYDPDLRPADRVQIEITNNGQSTTVIDGWIKRYLVVG